jgi:succinyl-diaminopimelate desuccinylase
LTPARQASEASPLRPLAIDAQAAVELARQLVRIRSVHDPMGAGGEAEVAALVAATMREFGWAPEVIEVEPGRPNVIATVAGGGGPGPLLAFEGHLDVVTEGDRDGWSVDPYQGVIRQGRLYGRGAADMKAGLAAMLHAVRALQLQGPFPGSVRLLALADEEGMMLGAKHAVASGALAGVEGVVVCEPEGDEVCAVSKGALRLQLCLTGRMAHGAMPHKGANPIPVLGRLIGALQELEHRIQTRVGEHPLLGWTYITPTVALAGSLDQMNVSPARATLAVDVRTVPGVDHQDLIEAVTAICQDLAAAAGIGGEVVVVDDRPAVDTPQDDPLVQCLVFAHEAVVGKRPRFGGVPGTTDGTIFTRETGVPTVVYGPGGKWIAHQADEYVEVEEISRYARVYAVAARAFLERGSR